MNSFIPDYPQALAAPGSARIAPRTRGYVRDILLRSGDVHYSVDEKGVVSQHYHDAAAIVVDGDEDQFSLTISVAETPAAAKSAYELCQDLCRRHRIALSAIPVDAPVEVPEKAEKPKKKTTPAPEAE